MAAAAGGGVVVIVAAAAVAAAVVVRGVEGGVEAAGEAVDAVDASPDMTLTGSHFTILPGSFQNRGPIIYDIPTKW